MRKTIASMVAGLVMGMAAVASAQDPKAAAPPPAAAPEAHVMVTPKDLKWGDAPPALPKGAKVAVLQGDMKSGPWTVRVEVPAKYKVMPHTHPTMEHVTVLSGTISMGMGEKLDEKAAMKMAPGSFSAMPSNTAHYLIANSKATFQVHGSGPFELKYIDPKDDPRNVAPAAEAAASPKPAK
jgi:quercetin dioxygenase-like cupin family protein